MIGRTPRCRTGHRNPQKDAGAGGGGATGIRSVLDMSGVVFKPSLMTFAALTVQNLLEERSRNPSSSLEERIESAKRRASQVRVKIQQDVVRFVLNVIF